MKVFKYQLSMQATQTLMLPENAEVLHMALQDGRPTLWCLVDSSQTTPKTPRLFRQDFTGFELGDKPGTYHGTFVVNDMVIHVFEDESTAPEANMRNILDGLAESLEREDPVTINIPTQTLQ